MRAKRDNVRIPRPAPRTRIDAPVCLTQLDDVIQIGFRLSNRSRSPRFPPGWNFPEARWRTASCVPSREGQGARRAAATADPGCGDLSGRGGSGMVLGSAVGAHVTRASPGSSGARRKGAPRVSTGPASPALHAHEAAAVRAGEAGDEAAAGREGVDPGRGEARHRPVDEDAVERPCPGSAGPPSRAGWRRARRLDHPRRAPLPEPGAGRGRQGGVALEARHRGRRRGPAGRAV